MLIYLRHSLAITTKKKKVRTFPFFAENLDKCWFCTDITEKVWQRLTRCAVRTDKLRQLPINSGGAETSDKITIRTDKLSKVLTPLPYKLIKSDKCWWDTEKDWHIFSNYFSWCIQKQVNQYKSGLCEDIVSYFRCKTLWYNSWLLFCCWVCKCTFFYVLPLWFFR